MTDPTPQRDEPPRRDVDRPVMGDHPDLETEDEFSREPVQSANPMARLLVPGIIVLVIVLIVIAFFVL